MDYELSGFHRRSQYMQYVEIENAESIVKCSFIVHKSVTYLDLSIPHRPTLAKKKELEIYLSGHSRPFSGVLPPISICTEEQLRRILAPNRKILYLYHLDLPNGRERSLRLGRRRKLSLIACSRVNSLRASPCLYTRHFRYYIQEAVKNSNQNVYLIMRYLKPMKFILSEMEYHRLMHLFLKILHSKCTDSYIFVKFIAQMDLREWLIFHIGERHLLESILFHSHRCAYDAFEQMSFCCDPINISMINQNFDYVPVFLRYRDAPRFTAFHCKDQVERLSLCVRIFQTRSDLFLPLHEGRMSSRRLVLLLQILFSFFNLPDVSSYSARSEALSFIWHSIPDAYITSDEMTRLCGMKHGIAHLHQAYATYKEAVAFDSSVMQPRSLRQHCRTIIRRSLCDNCQLPEGIDRLGLPNDIKVFLNLHS